MKNRKLGRRYGEALGELASEQHLLDQVEEELAIVREVLDGEPELREFLADPKVPTDTKDLVVQELFAQRLSRITLNFLRLVVAKQRAAYLNDMIDAYIAYANTKRGVIEVEVTTAAPLTESQADALIRKFSEITGRKIRLLTKQDEALLGGVVARIGDLVLDGSVRTRLEMLGESLKRAQLN